MGRMQDVMGKGVDIGRQPWDGVARAHKDHRFDHAGLNLIHMVLSGAWPIGSMACHYSWEATNNDCNAPVTERVWWSRKTENAKCSGTNCPPDSSRWHTRSRHRRSRRLLGTPRLCCLWKRRSMPLPSPSISSNCAVCFDSRLGVQLLGSARLWYWQG